MVNHNLIDVSLIGQTFAVTPILSTDVKVGDIVITNNGSRLMSPIRMDIILLKSLETIEQHLVLKLVRV
jgi:hypothetical protein